MTGNSFIGTIPDFGNLRHVQRLVIGGNNLTGESLRLFSSLTNCQDLEILEVAANKLSGVLPTSIENLSSSLRIVRAFECNISGVIPLEIGNLTSLEDFYLENNQLTGFISRTVGKLKSLQRLYLQHNKLDGHIPAELCQLSNLGHLYLSDNRLSGSIPPCLGDFKYLRRVYLDSNKLESTVPLNFWNLNDLLQLNLPHNSLSGLLPSEIENLKVIKDVDLSWNHFSGLIPKSLETLKYVQYFDIAHNRLEGEIPIGGNFANFTTQSFMQNYALCSEERIQFPHCRKTLKRSKLKNVVPLLKYILARIISIILAVTLTLSVIEWRRISYRELWDATNGFSESKILESGSFGTVYGGTLSDGLNVAVKVFNLESEEERATKSFGTESQVLSIIRHRNLV
ncbi:probable LRR receptor-like serine/threonine-protein kinase At3g47570 [Olea europaea var. sylvestris]|uniref:probable LRR receptor-like serine/threonine-protein kinase At3g47570 n=1 Tax=Olea europaea var. sylvestris TaxID=158386 RepID=UPI000C1CF1C5|nr:probable LRR receptor-like serine/threonine-protein kinase At3g47570 [Olea europaea var. sylvestris]